MNKTRFNLAATGEGYKGLLAIEAYLAKSGLPVKSDSFVEVAGSSQINGCAYCLDMHWKDLRAAGETEQRLYELDAWREANYYTDQERAALEWVEAVTLLTDGHVPDAVYESVKAHFNDKEMADLTLAAALINAWNRLAVASRAR